MDSLRFEVLAGTRAKLSWFGIANLRFTASADLLRIGTVLSDEKYAETSMTLLAQAAENDQQAWAKLTEVYGPLVYYWCRKSSLGPEDSADIFQNVFLSLSNNLRSFKKENEGDRFRAYLWTITRNKIRDFAKVRSGKAAASGGTVANLQLKELPEIQTCTHSELIALSPTVKAALDKLESEFRPKTWQMFWRVVLDDQQPAKVADEFGASLDSVYQAKSRVLKRLQKELGDVPI